jgi:hypothetical protein
MTIPNQAPDSSQSGVIQPIDTTALLEGQSLEDYLQQWVAAVAYLDGTMVRPRWQPEPPNIPDYGVDWAAVGIMNRRPVGLYPWVGHHSEVDGHDEMQRHEELDVLITFTGAHADRYAGNFHHGAWIWQNRAALRLAGMALIEVEEGRSVPELIKNQWWNRIDKQFCVRRIVVRTYPVLNLLSASGAVVLEEGYTSPFTVVPPAP